MIHKLNSAPVEQLRIPPHSIEAEQAVLGSLLLDNEIFDRVSPIISKDDFYSSYHQVIFDAVSMLIGRCQACDIMTLPDFLKRNTKLDEAGGETYIYELLRNVPSTANVSTYADIVRKRALLRLAIGAAYDVTEQCYSSDGSDAIEILGNAEKLIGDVSEKLCTKEVDYTIESAMSAAINEMEHRLVSGNAVAGIPTGLSDLDKKINGLEPADMVVIAARPAMGKTTLAVNMLQNEAFQNDGSVIMFSMEMPRQQLIYKILSSLGNINISSIQRPADPESGMSDEDWSRTANVMAKIKGAKLSIIDDAYMTIPRMRLEIRRHQKRFGKPTLIVADYLQLIRTHKKHNNRTTEIDEISRDIKALAKEFNCPTVVLSQLNRSLETRANKRPVNSDLRESGQIEQDADKIIFIYRDESYDEQTDDKGLAEIIVGKCRMGQVGMVGSVFDGAHSTFRPLAHRQINGYQERKAESGGFKL